jgi:hypothetical protein
MTTIGAVPNLTEAQKADPAISRALNLNVAGGALVGAGLLGVALGMGSKKKTSAVVSGLAAGAGLILVMMSRKTQGQAVTG